MAFPVKRPEVGSRPRRHGASAQVALPDASPLNSRLCWGASRSPSPTWAAATIVRGRWQWLFPGQHPVAGDGVVEEHRRGGHVGLRPSTAHTQACPHGVVVPKRSQGVKDGETLLRLRGGKGLWETRRGSFGRSARRRMRGGETRKGHGRGHRDDGGEKNTNKRLFKNGRSAVSSCPSPTQVVSTKKEGEKKG